MQRSTISPSVICALGDVEPARFGANQVGELRVDFALALLAVVPIEARAGLLPMAPHLGEHVGHCASKRGSRGRIPSFLARAIAHVEAGQIADRVRAHGHAPFLEHAIDALGVPRLRAA